MSDPVGFAGLSSRLTDVSPELERLSGVPAPAASSGTASAAQPVAAQSDGSHKRLAWFAGIAGIVLVVWFLNSRPNTSYSNSEATNYSEDVGAGDPITATAAASPTEISEVAPPIGTGQELDASQIAYCLAEEVRMTAAQTSINRSDSTAIEAFNAKVDDYNSRCGSYRYQPNEREQAQAYVDAHHADLVNSGVAEVSTGVDQPVVDSVDSNAVADQGE